MDLAENAAAYDQIMATWLSDSFSQHSLPALRHLTLKLPQWTVNIRDINALAIHAPNLTSLDLAQFSMPWDSFLALCKIFGNLSASGLEDLHISVYAFSIDMLKCFEMQ